MPTQPNALPAHGIDDVVYLKASAALGFLEGYKVSNIIFNPRANRWVYFINIKQSPAPGLTVGDFIDQREPRNLYFNESELCTMCEALVVAKNNLVSRLANIDAKLDAFDCGDITSHS